MAAPSYNYTLTNGSTADASQVMDNFTSILNGVTDGTKDLSISALTLAGTLTSNHHTIIGSGSGDDLTVNASLASTIPIKTTNSFDIGSSTLGLRALYFGANSQTVNIVGSGSMSATWTLTLPVTAGTANYLLTTNGSGVSAWTAITDSNFYASGSTAGTLNGTTQTISGAKTWSSVQTWDAAAATNENRIKGHIHIGSTGASVGSNSTAVRIIGNKKSSIILSDTSDFVEVVGGMYTVAASTYLNNQVSTGGGKYLIGRHTGGAGEVVHEWKTSNAPSAGADTAVTLTTVGEIEVDGTWENISGAWGTLSDGRLKKDVKDLTGALAALNALRPVSYAWREDEPHPLRPTEGFLADEVEKVNPKWVKTSARGVDIKENGKPVRIDAAKKITLGASFNAYVVAAIKELKAEIDALKS